MGGNKQQQAQRRQAKAAEKARLRKDIKKSAPVTPTKASGLDAIEVGPDIFPEADFIFWVCHGINCIVSDYENGTWTPLFEGIYAGVMPDAEAVIQAVMDKYNTGKANNEWPHEAKAALAWAVSDRKVVYIYYREALRRLTAAHGGDANIEGMARSPHNPLVWALFDYMRSKVLNRKH